MSQLFLTIELEFIQIKQQKNQLQFNFVLSWIGLMFILENVFINFEQICNLKAKKL